MSELAIAAGLGGSQAESGIVHEDTVLAAECIAVKDASLMALLPELETAIPAPAARCGVAPQEAAGIALGICAIVDGQRSIRATNGKYDDGVGFNFAGWGGEPVQPALPGGNETRLARPGERSTGGAPGVAASGMTLRQA